MILKTVFARFYKSFNFDYLRKAHPEAKPLPWEYMEHDGHSLWYPHVRIPIDAKITTVVGANESGKSQLLSAIEKAATGKKIERSDFCRYSQFFAVERDKMRLPDFGLEWSMLNEVDCEKLRAACGITANTPITDFLMFRSNGSKLTVYIPNGESYQAFDVTDAASLETMLPRVFRIDASVGLPDSVPIRTLAELASPESAIEEWSRSERQKYTEDILDNADMFKTTETVTSKAADLCKLFSPDSHSRAEITATRKKQIALAKDLICRISGVDEEALRELYKALRGEQDAYVNGIVHEINQALAANLNFPKWWVQDRDFKLLVSAREYDLVFTVRDRTGTEYSFSERSSGLSHFLSYYIQYLSYESKSIGPELLLMDEPDAFLSSQGQQDLMKIFDEFVSPRGNRPGVQVVYVTHSPFLVDKNHAERIRVLEKGENDEGTRVVRDAAKNHYEPLRSAFGAFVGETAFIGNCNIVVEGPADQILLAGAASHLTSTGVGARETLDLNHVTIVPSGSAEHVHYIVYLARGRDVVKPAVVVLLDSDESGKKAFERLKAGGPFKKQSIPMDYVLRIGDLPTNGEQAIRLSPGQHLLESEDLIPIKIYVDALQIYFDEIYGVDARKLDQISEQTLSSHLNERTSIFDAIGIALRQFDPALHVEKMGLARSVIEAVRRRNESRVSLDNALQDFEHNMKVLFGELTKRQRAAERELLTDRISNKVGRLKKAFLDDHSHGSATKEDVILLFENIEAVLDSSDNSEAIRVVMRQLATEFKLDIDSTDNLPDYPSFRLRLEQLHYAGRLATQVPEHGESAKVEIVSKPAEASTPLITVPKVSARSSAK